jgi:uncharacterized protein with GYD domain
MPTYIALLNWTDQGIRNAKQSPQRLDAARELGRQFGLEITASYLTMGAYDLVALVEAPDDQAMAKFALALAAGGNVRTTTLRAFPEAEYREIMQALP